MSTATSTRSNAPKTLPDYLRILSETADRAEHTAIERKRNAWAIVADRNLRLDQFGDQLDRALAEPSGDERNEYIRLLRERMTVLERELREAEDFLSSIEE